MEIILTTAIGFLVPLVEACGALVIVIEVLRTIVLYLISVFKNRPRQPISLRIRLGQSMVMGLEFQVAADILKTALSPQWNDVLLLAALIGLRTLLNYLMEYEIEKLESGRGLSTGRDDKQRDGVAR